MNAIRQFPVRTDHLHKLIEQALEDLRHARQAKDNATAKLAERRMNALLDQLSHRVTPADAPIGA